MLIRFVHKTTGKVLTLPCTQVVVCDDLGVPLAVTYQDGGIVVHSDATHDDFGQVVQDLHLGLTAQKVEIADHR
jgi:hypothetical protein